jgi:hypothetical protein
MTNCHRYRAAIKCSLNRSSTPQANGGWGTLIFILFILFLISKCSDHHDGNSSSGYLPEMPAAPDNTTPLREKEEPNGSDRPNPSWTIPNENVGSNLTPISPDRSSNPSDEREPAWIIPKEENQRAP